MEPLKSGNETVLSSAASTGINQHWSPMSQCVVCVCVCMGGGAAWLHDIVWIYLYASLPTTLHMFAGWIDLWKIAEDAEIQQTELEEARLCGEGRQ